MATPDPELEYLSPSFDPSSLTVPRLRSILVAHNVTYPASAKKPQLVDLFNENVAPQARRILNARSRTKRSARGITDVPPSQASTADEDESDHNLMPPPPAPDTTKRASRRVTRAPVEEEPHRIQTSGLVPGPVLGRRGSSKHARVSDTEKDDRPAPRRTRHSAISPSIKIEHPEPESWHREGADSPFTSDNPFQSGSSPPQEARSTDKDRRRKILGPSETKDKRKSSSNRRRTEVYGAQSQQDGIRVPTSKTFEMPVARMRQEAAETDGVEAGEDFTPEEQLELVRERAKSGQMDILPPRRRKKQTATGITRVAPWAIFAAMLGGLATVWRQEKLEVGYCGVGRPSTSLAGVQIPDWASSIQPQCEPCPQHAFCYPDLKTVCEPDFVLKPHPLSLGGLIPLPPTCEPDSQKARKVKAVADRAVEELRERNAKWECGELVDNEGKHVPTVEMDEEELKQEMSTKRRKGMSQTEFEDLWKGAIGEILGRDEVASNVEGNTGKRTLRSTSLARISFSCAIRRSIRLAVARHLWKLVGLLLILGSGGYARLSITSNRATEERAKQLASFALDRLVTQAALNAQDPRAFPEAWISMAQLRDDILRDEFSASRRTKLWEKVQKKVEQNSNVRPMVREGRSGDVSRVWEWVGAVHALEDGRSSGRRESSRFSLGPVGGPGRLTPVPVKNEDEGREMRELQIRNWDEGRPIY